MKHYRPLALLLAGLGVAGSLIALQAPASAGQGDPKKKELTETGCRNITAGFPRYNRDRTVDNPALQAPDGSYPDELQKNSGTARLGLVLDNIAPDGSLTDGVVSCPGVTYSVIAYGIDKQQLATASRAGDGTTGTNTTPFVLTVPISNYGNDCLLLVATTSVSGIVVDTAPDALPDTYDKTCDGGSPGLTYK